MTAARLDPPSFLDPRSIFDEMLRETGDVFTRIVPGPCTSLPDGLGEGTILRWDVMGPNPVTDIDTDARGVGAVMSFAGRRSRVFVAWDDIRQMACSLCQVAFPEPVERPAPKESVAAPVAKKKRASHLTLVE
jgi:hypothetical protein